MDDEDHRQVSETDGLRFAQEHGIPFFKISAYRNRNIKEIYKKFCILPIVTTTGFFGLIMMSFCHCQTLN